jgi:penicillin-binding protein 2
MPGPPRPLQLASAYAEIANGGTLWTPLIAAAVAQPDGTPVRPIEPKASGQPGLSSSMPAFLYSALSAALRS